MPRTGRPRRSSATCVTPRKSSGLASSRSSPWTSTPSWSPPTPIARPRSTSTCATTPERRWPRFAPAGSRRSRSSESSRQPSGRRAPSIRSPAGSRWMASCRSSPGTTTTTSISSRARSRDDRSAELRAARLGGTFRAAASIVVVESLDDCWPPRSLARIAAALVVACAVTAGCAQVNTDVSQLPTVELGEPAFYPTLQAYAAAPIVGGNDVQLLLNGEQIFPAMIEAIRAARVSITYAQYFFEDGPVSDDVIHALAERCRAGVAAHILVDGVGALNMPARHTEALRDAGCPAKTFRAVRPWALRRANNRNHRRILVV